MTEAARTRVGRIRFALTIAALAALWLSMLLLGGGGLDHRIYEALYAGRSPALVAVGRALTALGEPTVLIAAAVASALWLWWADRSRLAVALFLITMSGRGL